MMVFMPSRRSPHGLFWKMPLEIRHGVTAADVPVGAGMVEFRRLWIALRHDPYAV